MASPTLSVIWTSLYGHFCDGFSFFIYLDFKKLALLEDLAESTITKFIGPANPNILLSGSGTDG